MDQNKQPMVLPTMEQAEQTEKTPPTEPTQQVPIQTMPESKTNGMAIASFICGLLGLLGSQFILPMALAILGIVFGVQGKKAAEKCGSGKDLATAGLVCGIVGTVAGALLILLIITMMILAIVGVISTTT